MKNNFKIVKIILKMEQKIDKYKKAYLQEKEKNKELKKILEESNILFVGRKEALYG